MEDHQKRPTEPTRDYGLRVVSYGASSGINRFYFLQSRSRRRSLRRERAEYPNPAYRYITRIGYGFQNYHRSLICPSYYAGINLP